MTRPVAPVSVVDAAVKRLRDALFDGAYAAGDEVRDAHLAQQYGIARPTARIVVQRLVADGVLVRQPGFSARVRRFDAAQVRDIYRARRLVELDAVRTIRADDIALDSLDEAAARFTGADDWRGIVEADVAFHSAVVAAGGSPRLVEFFASIASEVRLLVALLREQYADPTDLVGEHVALLALLRDAPLDEVERAWRDHLDAAEEFLCARLSDPTGA